MSGAATLHLKRREERRLRHGSPWVYSNEVDVERGALTAFEPGQCVEVRTHAGQTLGTAYVNGHSLICARLFAREAGVVLDHALLTRRVRTALALRERLYSSPHYRLVYGESDDLPGLVVDRYGDVLVAQLGTAGMERVCDEVVGALVEVLTPRAVVLRNDSPARALEGLDSYVRVVYGSAPETLSVEENGLHFEVPCTGGQKTGWFYDHAPNRARLARYVRDAEVLDLFCYAGGFGVQAAAAGARRVTCVDASDGALDLARHNAALNDAAACVETVHGDAFQVLKQLRADGRRFDVIVLDPPAFIRRRKDMEAGQEAYRRLNRLAVTLLAADGILLSASCSSHLRRERFVELITAAVRPLSRQLRVLEQGRQGPDHPVHPALPESDYLKACVCRVYG